MKKLIALLIIAAGLTCSMQAQTPQAAAAKQKTPAAETRPAIDLSKVPLQEGIHEVYRDKKSGLRVFRIVNEGKIVAYFAIDKKGEVQAPGTGNTPTGVCPADVCFGSGVNTICLRNIISVGCIG